MRKVLLDVNRLAESIKVWEQIARYPYQPHTDRDCPLCVAYRKRTDFGYCDGCPILRFTKRQFCQGTPYERYVMHRDKYEWDGIKEAAAEEVEFLKSVKAVEDKRLAESNEKVRLKVVRAEARGESHVCDYSTRC